jgi:sulfur-oxidizing protein SoxY
VGAGAAVLTVAARPSTAHATPAEAQAAIAAAFGDRPLRIGRVALRLPPIVENGYSVPISIDVESPMTSTDHVRRIAVFSDRNPIATLVQFHLGPRAGRASVSTRIRLAGTQTVRVVAEMNDGSLWSAATETVVTLAACVIL